MSSVPAGRLDCDVVVVGGGTAGCVVAGRLAAESEAEVVVLEAGPDYGPRTSGAWPADLLDGGALVASHSWGYDTGPLHALRGPIELPRARVIGGCSAHNGCIVAVGCTEDYDGWARTAGDPSWSADALRPLFARALERLRVRTLRGGRGRPVPPGVPRRRSALGLPRADDLDDLDGGVGFGVEPVNVDAGVRVNTAFAYLDPARDRPNLRVVDRALCDRLVLDGDGVEVVAWRDGVEVRVHATTAVLAAGSYGSPAILLRSGIGDPESVAPHGIAPVHALPGVGRNLHDHPLVELDFAGSDELRAAIARAVAVGFVPEEQTLGKLRSSRASGPYDLHLIPVAAPEHSLLAGRTLLAVGAMEPRSRGRLTLASADPGGRAGDGSRLPDRPRRPRPRGAGRGDRLARELAATEPLRSLSGRSVPPGQPADLEEAIRRTHVHYYHPVGTCSLGRADDPLAVCDAPRPPARPRADRRGRLLADAGRPARQHERPRRASSGERIADTLVEG